MAGAGAISRHIYWIFHFHNNRPPFLKIIDGDHTACLPRKCWLVLVVRLPHLRHRFSPETLSTASWSQVYCGELMFLSRLWNIEICLWHQRSRTLSISNRRTTCEFYELFRGYLLNCSNLYIIPSCQPQRQSVNYFLDTESENTESL